MSDSDDIDALRRAKSELVELYRDRPWFRGAGIAPSPSGLGLRLNVDPRAMRDAGESVPQTHGVFPIEIVHIERYERRRVEPDALSPPTQRPAGDSRQDSEE